MCTANGNCPQCSRAACAERKQTGFGLALTSTGAAIAPLTGPAAPFVIAGSMAADLLSGIGSIFGVPPRGDLQKFQRTLYPYMRTLAQHSGIPAICYWFGDIVKVNMDGSYGIFIPHVTGTTEAVNQAMYSSGLNPYYMLTCPRSDDDCVNHPQDAAFQLYSVSQATGEVEASGSVSPISTVQPLPAGTTVPTGLGGISMAGFGGSSLLWIGVAAVALIAFSQQNKQHRSRS